MWNRLGTLQNTSGDLKKKKREKKKKKQKKKTPTVGEKLCSLGGGGEFMNCRDFNPGVSP